LLSGDFNKIELWREEQALKRTKARRPDLLGNDE
jgi:tRNA (guanine37-N1)-methyltransferase